MTAESPPLGKSTFRRLLVAVTLLGLPIILATCRLGELIGTPTVSEMVVTADSIVDIAALGSTAATRLEFDIIDFNNVGDGALPWKAEVALRSPWLTLSLREGNAPATLTAILSPVDLEEGVYRDTIRITPGSGPSDPVAIPVVYTIELCQTPAITGGVPVNDTLDESDCGAPHRTGSFAKVFSISGLENDSISVVMFATTFAPYVALSTGIDQSSTVLQESAACDGVPDTACLRYLVLPGDGTFVVEATSNGSGTSGPFLLDVGLPRAPSPPVAPLQFASDSVSGIQTGSTVPDLDLVFSAMVTDADPGDQLRLELEIRPVGNAFTGTPTHTSAPSSSGDTVYTLAAGLSDNTSYHWQTRTSDETGRASDWVPFGDNPETEDDFRVVVAEAPTTPTGLGQFESNEITPIPVGANTSEQFVVFKARVFDVDPQDQLRLEIEVREVGTDFTGAPNAVSVPVQSGDTARVAVSGFSDDTQYHWRARAIDQDNNVSLWVNFGGNPETAADFVIFLPGAPAVPGSMTQLRGGTTTVIAVGDTIAESQVSFRALLTDPDPGDSVKLQVEVQPVGSAFTNVPADSSGLVASGQTAVVDLSGLVDDTNFHWQARAVDGSGVPSAWTPFGGNAETVTDFRVAVMAQSVAFGTQPPGGIAGQAISPAVTIEAREASGAVDFGFSGTVTVGLTGGTGTPGAVLSGTLTRAFVNGVATFADLSVNLIGTGYTLTGTTASIGTAISQPFSINPASADNLAITIQPSAAATSGGVLAQQPAIQLRDVNNNAVNQAGILITATIATGGAGATLLTDTVSTNAAGLAQFVGLGINGLVGNYTLSFAAGGITAVTSSTIVLSAGVAAQLAVATQPSDTAQSGIAFPRQPAIQVRDAAGNNVSTAGRTVTASIATGGGALGGTVGGTTNAAGLATFTNLAISGTVGNRTMSFASTGLTSATSASVTIVAGAAANLAIAAGNGQSAVAGTPVAVAPSVRVTDAAGNNVPGAPVTFAVLTGGGTVAPTTPVNTGTNGVAAATTWTLGPTIGANTLRATTPGTTASDHRSQHLAGHDARDNGGHLYRHWNLGHCRAACHHHTTLGDGF